MCRPMLLHADMLHVLVCLCQQIKICACPNLTHSLIPRTHSLTCQAEGPACCPERLGGRRVVGTLWREPAQQTGCSSTQQQQSNQLNHAVS